MKTADMQIRLDKRLVKTIILIVLVAAAFVIVYQVMRWFETSSDIEDDPGNDTIDLHIGDPDDSLGSSDDRPKIWYQDGYYVQRDEVQTFLLMGIDKFENQLDAEGGTVFRNEELSDFLMLIVIDPENESCCQIHINRDTMTDVQRLSLDGKVAGHRKAQIALSHSYGTGKQDSCENTATAVSTLLYGTTVDHYMSLTMDAVSILNDQVGGVPVKINDDFSRIDPTLVKGETVTLMGDHALNFVRSRGLVGDETNVSRMKRQRSYMSSFYKQFKQKVKEEPLSVLTALLAISDYMVSDCSLEELSELIIALSEYENADNIISIEGESKVGDEFMEFYPDENALKKLVIETFYEKAE